MLCQFVQAFRVCLDEGRHLVDKSARSARADTVHPLFNAAGQENNLRILAAQFDDHVHALRNGFDF